LHRRPGDGQRGGVGIQVVGGHRVPVGVLPHGPQAELSDTAPDQEHLEGGVRGHVHHRQAGAGRQGAGEQHIVVPGADPGLPVGQVTHDGRSPPPAQPTGSYSTNPEPPAPPPPPVPPREPPPPPPPPAALLAGASVPLVPFTVPDPPAAPAVVSCWVPSAPPRPPLVVLAGEPPCPPGPHAAEPAPPGPPDAVPPWPGPPGYWLDAELTAPLAVNPGNPPWTAVVEFPPLVAPRPPPLAVTLTPVPVTVVVPPRLAAVPGLPLAAPPAAWAPPGPMVWVRTVPATTGNTWRTIAPPEPPCPPTWAATPPADRAEPAPPPELPPPAAVMASRVQPV